MLTPIPTLAGCTVSLKAMLYDSAIFPENDGAG